MKKAMMIKKTVLFLMGLTLAIALSAGSALANTAANTEINNKASLFFTGGSATASVTVRVSLVPSLPNVSITDANGAYTAPDSPSLTDSVIITSTANGPADYTVTPSVNTSANSTAPSVTIAGGAANTTVSIGATVTTGTSATTFLTIPAGGASGSGAIVNGIGAGDTIVFTVNGTTYTRQVSGTVDNADGTYQITLAVAIPVADVPGTGVQVGERRTVNLSVLPGTVVAPGTNIEVTVDAAVSSAGVADVTVTNTNANFWTSPSPNVNIAKYVRNLTALAANPAAGSGTTFTINTATREYYSADVTGKPGDTLEYVITATNIGSADLTGAYLADLLPEAFVTLNTAVYGANNVFYIDPAGAPGSFSALGIGANQASFVAGNDPNLIVNVGNGANNVSAGTIPAGDTVTIAYQVTIK
jgi:uncharacterized repeat protein (TIGR01451 family)